MEPIRTILERMDKCGTAPAIFWNNNEYTYSELLIMIDDWALKLADLGVNQGSVCGFVGDYSPQVCALIFALMKTKSIIVPFTRENKNEIESFKEIAGVEFLFNFDKSDNWEFEAFSIKQKNALIVDFLKRGTPGLVVFTSGSTGKPKGILHDCEQVMQKFVEERPGWKTILFLMIDHFGGFNTLLSSFSYKGVAICLPDRNPETVCKTIELSKATLLPTTPTFINFLIASRSYQNYDLSTISLITYGTEVMPAATLKKVREIFPKASIKQTYGLSELGVLRSKSESDDSLWVKIGGRGFETKLVDGVLWVRSESNMVGYLNAPNPINSDGWMCTGDQVEVRGEYMQILGRTSEIINVGGQKVFPAEIETILLEAENILEVSVTGKKHPIMGQVITATVSLNQPEDLLLLSGRLRKYCLERMAKWKVPVRFNIVSSEEQHNARFKKIKKQ
jgi:long-chain acyl-CoA synthetase